MRIVLPGGSGHLGRLLAAALGRSGHQVVVLSRRPDAPVPGSQTVAWDGRTGGAWMAEIDGADAVVSLATIYAHRYDQANDEATGIIGGAEDGVPAYWAFSVDIARQWERAQQEAPTPATRKVALRTSMVMAPGRGGAFDPLSCAPTR